MIDVDFRSMDLAESWNHFSMSCPDGDPLFNRVRFGVNVHFDIFDFLYGLINIQDNVGRNIVRIGNSGKKMKRDQFFTEIEERRKLIIHWLEENMLPESPWKTMELKGEKVG